MMIIQKSAFAFRSAWTHPANKGRRAHALARALGYQARARLLHQRTLARLGERSVIWVDLHRAAAVKTVYGNPPDFPEMTVWRRALHAGDLFVDVGANIGIYSIWAADLGADVIALEPAADTFRLLTDNIALNGYPIRAIQAAAGAAPGTARFTTGWDGLNRFAASGPAEVEVVTIDSVVGDRVVAGLKIDVEGSEIDVLRGCEKALSERRIGLLQLEWNHTCLDAVGTDRKPVAALLAEHGYSLARPGAHGELAALTDVSFGPDVFARPR